MRVLRTVVQAPILPMLGARHHSHLCCVIVGRAALLFQQPLQQAFGRLGVAPALDGLVKHIAILINGSPQPVILASDGDHNLVEVLNVTAARPLALKAAGLVWPELQGPPANCLIRDDDAALEQHLIDQSQAHRESEIELHCMGDDLGWEAVTFVADRQVHSRTLKPNAAAQK